MPTSPSPADIERAFARAHELQGEVARRQRAVSRRIEVLARGLASLMAPDEHLHRIGVGIHAFAVDGSMCIAAAYLEKDGDGYRYRYAVLCGGEAARRILRTAPLGRGDSDEPGPNRRVALATHEDYDDFLYRLPKYIGDIVRRAEDQLGALASAEDKVTSGRKLLSAAARRRRQTRTPASR